MKYQLKKDVTLRNTNNHGKSPLDPDWDKDAYRYLKKGDEVNIEVIETLTGKYYKIWIKNNGVIYDLIESAVK